MLDLQTLGMSPESLSADRKLQLLPVTSSLAPWTTQVEEVLFPVTSHCHKHAGVFIHCDTWIFVASFFLSFACYGLGTEGWKNQFIFRQHGANRGIWYEPAERWLMMDKPGGTESAQNGRPWMSGKPKVNRYDLLCNGLGAEHPLVWFCKYGLQVRGLSPSQNSKSYSH